ncbi:hypothetical protein GO491_02640 [Flavobacteriaceae bacterium Ap0902]|nr:hypothetical protein [Flavobacteriaceae bacterium Ap0902]
MKNLKFPIALKFHIATLSNDFSAKDANGNMLAYMRQEMLKLKEHIQIFADSSKKDLQYEIKADRWLDFNASYSISYAQGNLYDRISRKGMRSFWSATYHVIDAQEQDSYTRQEKNPWVKFIDSSIGELPIIGWFTGYFLNPNYLAKNKEGKAILELKKNPSFFGRKFTLNKLADFAVNDEPLLVLSFMMMVLLERSRG